MTRIRIVLITLVILTCSTFLSHANEYYTEELPGGMLRMYIPELEGWFVARCNDKDEDGKLYCVLIVDESELSENPPTQLDPGAPIGPYPCDPERPWILCQVP